MCEGLINFENGKKALFYTTTAFPGGDMTTVLLQTKNHRIEIRDNSILYVDGNRIERPELVIEYVGKACYGNGHDSLIKMFYESIMNDTDVPVSIESASYALRILLAAYESGDKETII